MKGFQGSVSGQGRGRRAFSMSAFLGEKMGFAVWRGSYGKRCVGLIMYFEIRTVLFFVV
jgi:hypothetical protein